jgi:hypothetical protein
MAHAISHVMANFDSIYFDGSGFSPTRTEGFHQGVLHGVRQLKKIVVAIPWIELWGLLSAAGLLFVGPAARFHALG